MKKIIHQKFCSFFLHIVTNSEEYSPMTTCAANISVAISDLEFCCFMFEIHINSSQQISPRLQRGAAKISSLLLSRLSRTPMVSHYRTLLFRKYLLRPAFCCPQRRSQSLFTSNKCIYLNMPAFVNTKAIHPFPFSWSHSFIMVFCNNMNEWTFTFMTA